MKTSVTKTEKFHRVLSDVKLIHIYLLSIGGFGPLTKDSVIREATELSNPELEESGSGSLRILGKLALLWVGSSD